MRVKIRPKEYGIDKLKFGKRYVVGYIGATYSEEFVFTRKKTLKMIAKDKNNRVEFSHHISKSKLKKSINNEEFVFIGEIE